ncbi:MAG: hypothetical protein A2W03_00075 [Candidatus Aminicenantes bacterium RBG_16_63_16]|nr:MAG: hypothetical protein A2W03_00075 [Candidatus Aminicenantes bacterium RBG_16_63_16]
MVAIMKDLGDAVKKPQPTLHLPEEKQTAVEVDLELFALEVFKKKPFGGLMNFVQSCFLLVCSKRIVNQYVTKGNSFFYE